MHRLLERQLKRVYGKDLKFESLDDKMKELLLSVSQSYDDYTSEVSFVEHTLELSSNELYEANSRLQSFNETLEEKVKNEVLKNRDKDLLILQQSRHAQMGEMIAMIAHQWRQPLATISTIVASLQIQNALDEYDMTIYDEQLYKISDCTQHLSKTIRDFREFFKEEKQMIETTLEEIIDESINIIIPLLSNKSIDLKKTFLCNEKLLTFPNELMQVVLSLTKNAQDAIEEKNIENAQIQINTYSDEAHCYIEIKDNAGGIPVDVIGKIFEPYFTTKSELNGTGLGLYMAKMIINEHCKGKIRVDNTDEGACFTITLNK